MQWLYEFRKRLQSTLDTATVQSRKESVHKIAGQEIEGFTHPIKTYLSSVKVANLPEEKIIDTLKLLSWYIHRFWKNLVRHIVPATK